MNIFYAIALVVLAGVIGSFGAILLKQGSKRISFGNKKLLIGLAIYGSSALIYIFSLRYGPLSILYPVASTAYIWISILSVRFLKEKMNLWKWAGITLIIAGISLIGLE